jgi:hypothetical protein
MRERHASRAEMKWEVMDVLDLKCDDESFDVVIDKGIYILLKLNSGTME